MANHESIQWQWKGINFQVKNEKTGLLTNKSLNINRLITIVNWDLYQKKDGDDGTDSSNQVAYT